MGIVTNRSFVVSGGGENTTPTILGE